MNTESYGAGESAPGPWRAVPRWPFFALLLAGVGWLSIDERLRG